MYIILIIHKAKNKVPLGHSYTFGVTFNAFYN